MQKKYEGFTAKEIEQKIISEEPVTEVEIYYDRNLITLTFDANGGKWADGSESKTVSGKFGASVEKMENPEREEYRLTWDKILQATFEKDETYTAVWKSVVLYVSGSGDVTAGDGSKEKPFASVDKACEIIIEEGNESLEWVIKISGELLPASPVILPENLTSENAKSLMIKGATGLDSTDLPQDSINRNKAGSANAVSNGSVLIVNSSVPVTISNLKITGGYGSSSTAGGITIAQGATVSLADGALIGGNRNPTNGRGGAVHNEGTLYMYGSATIGDKTNGGKTDESLYSCAADSSSYNDFNKKKMSNYGTSGGGIFNGSADSESSLSAKVYLGYRRGDDGNPVKEELTGGLYYNGGNGGALYNASGSFVYFDSGNFSWNGTSSGGAAIRNAGQLEMSGGTIEHNMATGSSTVYGGAVYNEDSSSVFIMSGGTINHNLAYRNSSYGDLSYGGALYNNGKFYMYGTAVIGAKNATKAASKANSDSAEDDKTTQVTSWGNKAYRGGAVYNNVNKTSGLKGCLYLGYRPGEDGDILEEELRGGIYYNYSSYVPLSPTDVSIQYGGGAIESFGTVKIASGTIAYNRTEGFGGAVRYSETGSEFEISGGTIRDNEAAFSGGAIYMSSSSSNILTLSGSVLIPAGVGGENDIHLTSLNADSNPKIELAGPLPDDFAACISLEVYEAEMTVIKAAGDELTSFASECAKFSVANEVNSDLGIETEWYVNESGILTCKNPLGTLTMTITHTSYSDFTLTAKYYATATSSSGTTISSGSEIPVGKYLIFTVAAPAGRTLDSSSIKWFLDGEEQTFAEGEDTSTFKLDTAGWTSGVYDIAVEACDTLSTPNYYSGEWHITVKAD